MAETTADAERHQSGGLAVALAKLNLDALTVADAVADVTSMAGENVTTALRADIKELGGSIQSLQREMASLQREIATLRWMIGISFTLLSVFIAISTFLRS